MVKRILKVVGVCLLTILFYGIGMITMANSGEHQFQKALIIVDPGYSKFSLQIGEKISHKLAEQKIATKLITVRDFKTQDLTGIDLLVLGGPTYMAQPSNGLKKLLPKLKNTTSLKTLVFQTGGTDCGGLAPLGELAKAQGLTVIGSIGILNTPKAALEIDSRIDALLTNLK